MNTQPTHIITTVEAVTIPTVNPIYGPDELQKEFRKSLTNQEQDILDCLLIPTMTKDTAIKTHELFYAEFKRQEASFSELIDLAEACKDLMFNRLCAQIIDFIEQHHSHSYRRYKMADSGDFTGGSLGSDNR